MTIFSRMDTERVILQVKTHECVWNPKNEQYKSQMAKYKAWAEISQAVFPKFATCSEQEQIEIVRSVQARWKTARDAYMKCRLTESRKSTYKSKHKRYIYHEQLQFLEQIRDTDKEKGKDENDTSNISENDENQAIYEVYIDNSGVTCDEEVASDIDMHDTVEVEIQEDENETAVRNIQTSNDDEEEKFLPGTSSPNHKQEATETVVDKRKASRKRLRNIPPKKLKSQKKEYVTRLLNAARAKPSGALGASTRKELETRLLPSKPSETPAASTSTSALQADDQSFFNSFAPVLNNFNVHQKLLFRSKMLEIVMEVGNIGPMNVKQEIETYVCEETEEDND